MVYRIISVALLALSTLWSNGQSLRKTTKRFVNVVSQLEISETEFMFKLKPLIDPSANVDSLCADYYGHWKYNKSINSYPLKTKIEAVKKSGKHNASVQISNIWNMPNGEKYYFLSESYWIKSGSKWYRTTAPSKYLEQRKL
ncbi:MAG: hypothetical protein MRY83_06535 [Flavobacteriales bacterium]|nr:hypothetical protein [Flavobacteriales bacterium]